MTGRPLPPWTSAARTCLGSPWADLRRDQAQTASGAELKQETSVTRLHWTEELQDNTATVYRERLSHYLPMLDILPLWLYCCLTLALLAAVASMAELDLPGVECLGDPLLREATTQC